MMQIPNALKTDVVLIAAGAIGLMLVARNLRGIAGGLVEGAADVIVEAGTGVVLGIGDVIGVPRTDADLCEEAMRTNSWWQASKVCPAATFLNFATGGYIDTKNKGL
jgi:hypothetical protein